jgi:hypothetical protein
MRPTYSLAHGLYTTFYTYMSKVCKEADLQEYRLTLLNTTVVIKNVKVVQKLASVKLSYFLSFLIGRTYLVGLAQESDWQVTLLERQLVCLRIPKMQVCVEGYLFCFIIRAWYTRRPT